MPVKPASQVEEEVLKFLNIAGRGFILNNVPFLAQGLIVEVMKRYNITLKDVLEMVNKNENMWNRVKTEDYPRISNAVIKLGGDISWFTSDFFIDSIRKSHPVIASLFLSDRRSIAWLNLQVSTTKVNIEKLKTGGNYAQSTVPANDPGHGETGV